MTHEDLQSLLGAYALDALDPEETIEVQEHLAECPRCRSEVAAHLETVSMLANVGGDTPTGVWDRIAAEVAAGEAEEPTALPPANLVPISARRQLPLGVVAALATAAAVAVALLGVNTVRLNHRVNSLRDAMSAGGLQQAAAAALLSPQHQDVRLESADNRLSAAIVIAAGGNAYLVSSDLPALSPADTYQLWGLAGGKVVSLGLLGNDPRVAAFHIDTAVSRLMVTAEPRGGVPQPDTPVVVGGDVPT